MNYLTGFAGFSYLIGDFVATLSFFYAMWISGAAFLNLISDGQVDAPVKAYLGMIFFAAYGITGQVAIWNSGMKPSVSGIFGLDPNYPMVTIGFAIALFVISRFMRNDKYR